jgi:hypothetical protein
MAYYKNCEDWVSTLEKDKINHVVVADLAPAADTVDNVSLLFSFDK